MNTPSDDQEIEVTEEMVRAGVDALGSVGLEIEAIITPSWSGVPTPYSGRSQVEEGLARAFRAMLECSQAGQARRSSQSSGK